MTKKKRQLIKYYAAEFKIILAMVIIFTGLLLPVNFWPAHVCLIAFIFIGQSLIKIPLAYLFKRLLFFLPFVIVFSLSIPLTQGFHRGWDIASMVLLRSIVAFMTMLWLTHIMTFGEILASLQKLRFPPLLLIILSFMFRYCFILWEELKSMRTARRTRTFHQPGTVENWVQSSQLIGMLLIRSLKRSERIHQAMCARGWNGQIHFLDNPDKSFPNKKSSF